MDYLEVVGSLVATVFSIVGVKVAASWKEYLLKKVSNVDLRSFFEEAPKLMGGIVRNVYQVYVKQRKVAGNGKLTEEEKAQAKKMAIEEFKSSVGETVLKIYESHWGQGEAYIRSLVEGALIKEKNYRLMVKKIESLPISKNLSVLPVVSQ